MASLAIRIKSVFVPSTRRAPPATPSPTHPVPAINAVQSKSQPSPAMTHKTTSTVLSDSSTVNVHFSPKQVDQQLRSPPRYVTPGRNNSSAPMPNYKTYTRPRSQSMPASKRPENVSAYASVRVPTLPGVSVCVPRSILLSLTCIIFVLVLFLIVRRPPSSDQHIPCV